MSLILLLAASAASLVGQADMRPPEAASTSAASIGFDTTTYLYGGNSQLPSFFPNIEARVEGGTRGRLFEASAKGLALVVPAAKTVFHFEVPEAYIGTSPAVSPLQLKLGRKLESWSKLDDAWGLGLWQPRFRLDYVHPDAVGLVGAFAVFEIPGIRLVGFGTPLFLPDHEVPFKLENGEFVSPSPWFIPPRSQITLFSQDTPVKYRINTPAVRDVVLNPGCSVMARFGTERGPWGSIGYAYKPMNQPLMAYDGYLNLNSAEPRADVSLYPRFAYHQIASIDVGYSGEWLGFGVSALGERPIDEVTRTDLTAQRVAPATAMGASVEWKFDHSAQTPGVLGLSYLRQWGGNTPDVGPMAVGSASVFDPRYPFQKAIQTEVKGTLPWGRRLSGSSRLLFDMSHVGSIWSTELNYRPARSWVMGVGVDFFSSVSDSHELDFIRRYQSNDRVHAGVTYVF